MKVYKFDYKASYGGGCAIVAANSELEAFGKLCDDYAYTPDYTDINHCVELQDLNTSLEEPKVIYWNMYME